MGKRRREEIAPVQDEHRFGIFYVERPEDMARVRQYLSDRRNSALVILAPGLRRAQLPPLPDHMLANLRVVARSRLAALIARGELLPPRFRT